MDDDLAYKIRFRAHELWLESGSPDASSLELWNVAEAELASEQSPGGLGRGGAVQAYPALEGVSDGAASSTI